MSAATKDEKIVKVKAVVEESEESKAKRDSVMGRLLTQVPTPPAIGSIVEGPVLANERGAVYIDLYPFWNRNYFWKGISVS